MVSYVQQQRAQIVFFSSASHGGEVEEAGLALIVLSFCTLLYEQADPQTGRHQPAALPP